MKIPDFYIEELNDIFENLENYSAPELYRAYKELGYIRMSFGVYGVLEEDDLFTRLVEARQRIDRKLEKALIDYEGLKIEREVRNEGKS